MQVRAKGMVHGAGDVARHRIDGLDRAGKAFRRARIDEEGSRVLERRNKLPRIEYGGGVGGAAAGESRRARSAARTGSPDSTAPPACCHAVMPPSSTATCRCPSERISHQARAANDPFDSS